MKLVKLLEDNDVNRYQTVRFQQGDEAALTYFYHNTFSALFSICKKLIHDDFMANCLVNESFLIAWTHRSRIKNFAHVYRFMRIQLHQACATCKANRIGDTNVDRLEWKQPSYARQHFDHTDVDQTTQDANIFPFLSRFRQQILRLYYQKGKSQREIAQFLGTSTEIVLEEITRSIEGLKTEASRICAHFPSQERYPIHSARVVLASETAILKIHKNGKPGFDSIADKMGLSPRQVIALLTLMDRQAPNTNH